MNFLKRLQRKYYTKKAMRLYKNRSIKAIPTQLGLCMTHLCNIKCKICMRETYKPPKGQITLPQIKNLMPRMPYISGVCIMGLCEPLLNPETPRIIQWLKLKGEYGLSLTTNGMVDINHEILESFQYIDDMVFSIDSPDPETMRAQRGGADLDRIMKNMNKVLDYKRDHGLGAYDNPPIHINAVMTHDTFPQVPDLIEFLEPYAKELTYLMVDPVTRPDYSIDTPFVLETKERNRLPEYRKLAKESPLKVVGFDWMFEGSREWGRCLMSWTGMFVHPNGDAYFCYDYRYTLGNIFTENPLDVWNSPKALDFRRKLLSPEPPIKQCYFCNFARQGWQLEGDYNKNKEDIIP